VADRSRPRGVLHIHPGRPFIGPKKGSSNMLVLSRQCDESIVIGGNIVITIVDVRGDKVRLGIQAPTDIPVHREEVYNAIHALTKRDDDRPPLRAAG
jgi:carbon storage regulator